MLLGKFKALSRGKAQHDGTHAVPHWRGGGGGLEPESSPDYTETPSLGKQINNDCGFSEPDLLVLLALLVVPSEGVCRAGNITCFEAN